MKLQSHKKIVIESDSRRPASTDAKHAVLSSRDPRTVCMTEDELAYLRASFRVNRWPERAEKERLARLIGKSYEKVHHWFSNQRQKLANVEKALKHPAAPETPLQSRSLSIVHMTGTGSTKGQPGGIWSVSKDARRLHVQGNPRETDRTVLRPYTPADEKAFLRLWSDPVVQRTSFVEHLSPTQTEQFLQRTIQAITSGSLFFTVVEEKERREFMGTCQP
ncbi:hypothetical protein H4582DRAFT_2072180 [Lactarius indigo]|nr:hypothetical protein H4582DRAFT_2072180 [Lactarius indigo]